MFDTLTKVETFQSPVVVDKTKSPKLQFQIKNDGTESAYKTQIKISSEIALSENRPSFCKEEAKVKT